MNVPKHIEAQAMHTVGMVEPALTAIYKSIDLEAIKASPLSVERMIKIWDIGTKISNAITPHTACRNGCNHCCSQAVTINGAEADIIARHLHVVYNEVPEETIEEFLAKVDAQRIEFTGKQCPFIQEGKCSIYEVRPMSCRLHFNISNTPSLCDTNTEAEVPNFNFVSLNKLQVLALARETTWGDIREYFPDGIKTKKVKETHHVHIRQKDKEDLES